MKHKTLDCCLLTLIVILAFVLGDIMGSGIYIKYQREAIERGYAHYELNQTNGTSTWMWNTNK